MRNVSSVAMDAATCANDSAQSIECTGCHEFYPRLSTDEVDEGITLCPWCSETYHDVEIDLRPCPECRRLKECDEFVGDVCCECRERNRLA